MPMIQGLETSLRAGAVPQPPQIRPAAAPIAAAPAAATQSSAHDVEARSPAADDPEAGKTPGNGDDDGSTVVPLPPVVQPAAAPAAAAQVSAAPAVVSTEAAAPPDPLAEAKSRVQEEIRREFAAIMAAGTARAGEAAALATRRVMERHGQQRAAGAAQRV